MGWRSVRGAVLAAVAVVASFALSTPLTQNPTAEAAGQSYKVSDWTDPDGKQHRIRWNPCQSEVTYSVNPRLAGRSAAARRAAVADVRSAFGQVGRLTGIDFTFAGRTDEIPRDRKGEDWSKRQRSAEIVVAWVDQSRAKHRSNLLSGSGDGYASGVGGWMMRAWTDQSGGWHASIGRGFVVLNAAHNRMYRPGFGAGVTRGALLLHEIGHATGLGHVGTTRELMYPTMLERRSSTYQDGDREGLSRVGRTLGCIPGATKAWPQI